ncbi:inositol monophosphatase family protein [Pantoea endophytica]
MTSLNNSAENKANDAQLLKLVTSAVQSAGMALKQIFCTDNRPKDRKDIVRKIAHIDVISLDILRQSLSNVLPHAQWVEDEEGTGKLPAGEWWITDPVEGAVNFMHGLQAWGVTLTLVRNNEIVLTAVHLPMSDDTYTALRGGGAWLNDRQLQISTKTHLNAAIVGTCQAMPNESDDTYRYMGLSVIAMLKAALVVNVSVPATLQLIQVAAGRQDLFWQHSQVRSGLLAGALLVSEAGGKVTDLQGAPWHLDSPGFLASSPLLAEQAAAVLTLIAKYT